jgi:hypothetical protein
MTDRRRRETQLPGRHVAGLLPARFIGMRAHHLTTGRVGLGGRFRPDATCVIFQAPAPRRARIRLSFQEGTSVPRRRRCDNPRRRWCRRRDRHRLVDGRCRPHREERPRVMRPPPEHDPLCRGHIDCPVCGIHCARPALWRWDGSVATALCLGCWRTYDVRELDPEGADRRAPGFPPAG